jgi:UDP-N-acetylmuramoylalanine--D-glutamate ligase
MIPVCGYEGCTVAVLGLGRSGFPTVMALSAGGAEVIAWDDDETSRSRAVAAGIRVQDLSTPRSFAGVACMIVSPGIPHLYPRPHPAVDLAMRLGVKIDNDIGLFFQTVTSRFCDNFESAPQIVCVTGSNGKSTTCALIYHILSVAGRQVQLGGNFGRGALDMQPPEDRMVIVLELSSYQIDLARTLSPDIGVFLNISADHLDRHGGMGGYFAAKRRLFTEGGPRLSVIGVDETEGRFLANTMQGSKAGDASLIAISTTEKPWDGGWSVTAKRGFLAEWRNERQLASIDLRNIGSLPGSHNHQNACAAYAVARSLGLGPKLIARSLSTYPGLRHRCQTIAEWEGIRIVNDSKATNADAAARSLGSFDRIRWIAGGIAKEGGIEAIRPLFGRIAKAYLIGDAASEFAATLGSVPHEISVTIDTAVQNAMIEAKAGETVLLAPACASFDQFESFEARGDSFERLVKAHTNLHLSEPFHP